MRGNRVLSILGPGLLLAVSVACSDQPVAPAAAAEHVRESHTTSEALNAYITGPTQLLSGQGGTWTAPAGAGWWA
jgi:hypothetical protein